MSRVFRLLTLMTILSLWFLLLGCASSPPTKFYTLSSISGSEKVDNSGSETCISIGVGPVKIPEYLDQAGVVTDLNPNEYLVGEFSKWSEPLGMNISRILARNLTSLLCTKIVSTFPWVGSLSFDYRVIVEVIRMDGVLGENARLDASWMIYDGTDRKKLLLAKMTQYKEALDHKGYESYVAAQSRNVAALSRDIAEAIKALPR